MITFPTANLSGISISFRCSFAFLFKLPSVGSGSGVSPGESCPSADALAAVGTLAYQLGPDAMARKKRLITRSVPLNTAQGAWNEEVFKGYGVRRFVTREVHGDMNVSPEVSRVLAVAQKT